ncbi:hypothetical protein FJT64_002694 [Amphibalanus amphitrite]|uniref:Gustatory receptor n=1 Tax=Amphibalanus amphitrite TaxID=1232801 RepID=A0A6A4WHF6_AMPAM|nr:hypothetical protein FJT64_002694 [Amphibalanus amphitrite]
MSGLRVSVLFRPHSSSVGASDMEAAGGRQVLSRSARALIMLFRVAALSGGPGCRSSLYAAAHYGFNTLTTVLTVSKHVGMGLWLLRSGSGWMRAILTSYGFGTIVGAAWATLTLTFARGRRRCGALLVRLPPLLREEAELTRLWAPERAARRQTGWWLWLVVVLPPLATISLSATDTNLVSSCITRPDAGGCAAATLRRIAFTITFSTFQLVPVKFLFVARQLEGGLDALNAGLAGVLSEPAHCLSDHIQHLRGFQKLLSASLKEMMAAMGAELILSMMYGVLIQVSLCLLLANALQFGTGTFALLISAVLFVGAAVCLVAPCEACQRLLGRLEHCSHLLLQLEEQCPEQLRHDVTLLQKKAVEDTGCLGDLGLFRLRRSTLLSIFSTILTYIIVMVQFHLSEEKAAEAMCNTSTDTVPMQ